jgi:phage terminase small subunit
MGLGDRPQNFKPGHRLAKGRRDKGWQGRKATLTPRAEMFAREYAVDLDGPAAVRRAGYNVTDKSAQQKAAHLLADPRVAAIVADRKAKQAARLDIKADRVLLELERVAYMDPGELAKAGISSPAGIAALPEDVRRAVVGWSWDASGNFVIKWAAKQAALEALGRHLKLSVDRIEVKDVTDRASALARARARAMQARTAPDPASAPGQEASAPG